MKARLLLLVAALLAVGVVIWRAATRPTSDAAAGTEAEMEPVKFVVRDFRAALGENPVGNNAEITKALMGANRKKTRLLDTAAVRLNDKGELVDHWDTPYFFHQISAQEMEIRSAGPDK